MTRRWPCIVVAVLCCLFALATTAGGETLWEQTTVFGTKAECLAAARWHAGVAYSEHLRGQHREATPEATPPARLAG